jgi:hypothetical protein
MEIDFVVYLGPYIDQGFRDYQIQMSMTSSTIHVYL